MKFTMAFLFSLSFLAAHAESPAAKITGAEDGWKPLLKVDFNPVNSAENTWTFDDAKQTIYCTG